MEPHCEGDLDPPGGLMDKQGDKEGKEQGAR